MTNVWFLQAVAAALLVLASALIFRELLASLGPKQPSAGAGPPRSASREAEPPLRRAA